MKKIYNILIKVFATVAITSSMMSCLEKFPGDAILEDEGMQTFRDAEQTLTGIYSALMSGSLYSGYLTLLPDIQADLVHAVQGNTNTYGTHWLWDIRSTNSEIASVYGSLYYVIGCCNLYLDKVSALRESLTDDMEITYLDYYTGEVYCARALAYSELLRCFCKAYDKDTASKELGVAIDSTYFGQKPLKRSSLKDSYDFVIRDLKKAEQLLEDAEYGYSSPYFTLASANALHARTALYMKDDKTAVEYATKLIEDSHYALSTSASYTSGVSPITGASKVYNFVDYMWTNDLSTEVIWMVDYTITSYGGTLGQVFLNYTNDYTYFYPDYIPSEWVIGLYASSDARRTAYFRTLTTGYQGNPSLTLLVKYFGNHSDFIPYNIYHVSQPKPMRLAEQYLIRAEAYCRLETPEFGKASSDLKTLSSARGASVGSLSSTNWLSVISDERVKELYMEGFRLNDLKRWQNLSQWSKVQPDGRVFKREKQSSALNGAGSTLEIKTDDYRFVWPIPQHEIEAPGSGMKGQQNKGY
jgi:hypothetical protein